MRLTLSALARCSLGPPQRAAPARWDGSLVVVVDAAARSHDARDLLQQNAIVTLDRGQAFLLQLANGKTMLLVIRNIRQINIL